jgi:hypothetical protein
MNIVVSIAIVGITLALALVAYGVLALKAFLDWVHNENRIYWRGAPIQTRRRH